MAKKFHTGSKTFEISGYSFTKRIGDGNFIQSDSFNVAGYDWAVEFYPFGFNENGIDHVAAGLKLLSEDEEAKAVHAFYLMDFFTNKWVPMMTADCSPLLTYSTLPSSNGTAMWGRDSFIKRDKLEAPHSKFLKDDTLVIKCIIWVEN
jgi:speckle-type POZ protein